MEATIDSALRDAYVYVNVILLETPAFQAGEGVLAAPMNGGTLRVLVVPG